MDMRFDIAPIEGKYRGMERTVDIPWNPKTKKVYKQLLEKYYSHIELECNGDYDYESLEKMIAFYKELCTYGISCEMIAFSNEPLEQVHGYPIELLGIDIVHDMCESLIEDEINPQIAHLLNDNGLCNTEADVEKIIPFQDHGGVEWLPCYVYKILLGDIEVKKGGNTYDKQ